MQTMLQRQATAECQPLAMFYIRADTDEGHSRDLTVIATNATEAIELWAEYYYDEEHEATAELWATEGMGMMTLAMPGDLHQIDLVPSVISWAIEPVPYPARQ